jgi:hypothetical protein
MKYLPLLLIFFGCYDSLSPEEYFELCPYELKYGGSHYLEVPISVTPHQKTYSVGDTMNVKMFFSDSIYDLSRETSFKIENFPFEPANQLYRIEEDAWQSGYRLNELIVDEERYNTRYNFQSRVSDDFRGFTVYENGYYHFEYDLVFDTPGTYIIMTSDQYMFNLGSGLSDLNEQTNAIEFEGRCPDTNFFICSVIQGDPHYYDFLDELIYLDKEIQADKLARIENLDDEHFGSGGIPIDWNGIFCFEVVE